MRNALFVCRIYNRIRKLHRNDTATIIRLKLSNIHLAVRQ